MTCTACSVIPGPHGWLVERDGLRTGPYLSDEIAVRVAVAEVERLQQLGQPCRISLHDKSGDVRAEYCLCREFGSR